MHTRIDKHIHKNKGVGLLARNSLLVAFAFASLETIWPVFLFSFFQSDVVVGYVTAGFAVLGVIGLATLYPLFHKYNAKDLYYVSLIVQSLLFILYTQLTNKFVFLGLAVISVFFSSIRIQAFGILLRENSSQKNIEKNEGFVYYLANIGWVIAPLLAGVIADGFGMRVVLVFSAVCLLVSVYNIAFARDIKEAQVKEKPKPFFRNVKNYFTSTKRVKSYILAGGLEMWYVLPYVFLPLYMVANDIGFDEIGMFMFAFAIPLVIMQYWIKKQSTVPTRRLLQWGYIIVAIATFCALLSNNIYVSLGFFVIGAFGSGLLEPSVESYFFKITSMKEERDYYGTFMTSQIVGGFIGRVAVASVLLFAPLTVGIGIIGVFMTGQAIVALTIQK